MQVKLLKLQEEALQAAVTGNWKDAINYNLQIINANPDDLSAHLRLGFAYLQNNQLKDSKKSYEAAITIQPGCLIARTNIDKIKILETQTGRGVNINDTRIDPNLFLNVSGKTKVIELLNVGHSPVLASLKVGQPLDAKTKKRRIEVRTLDNAYVGAFPDDISKRLIYFIEEGSEYSYYIKEATKSSVFVFIKEEKKGKNVQKFTSFPKNIQDDLKLMHADEETSLEKDGEESDESDDEFDESGKEAPIDIEALAEEHTNSEYYPEVSFEDDFEEDFEE